MITILPHVGHLRRCPTICRGGALGTFTLIVNPGSAFITHFPLLALPVNKKPPKLERERHQPVQESDNIAGDAMLPLPLKPKWFGVLDLSFVNRPVASRA